MANTDITSRTQYERNDLADRSGLRRGSERGAAIYNAIALVVGGLLCAVALATIESWAQWVVLGAIIMTVIGFMIAVSPNRRA